MASSSTPTPRKSIGTRWLGWSSRRRCRQGPDTGASPRLCGDGLGLLDAILACALGPVERGIGGCDERALVLRAVGDRGDAEARGDRELASPIHALEPHPFDGLPHALGDLCRAAG